MQNKEPDKKYQLEKNGSSITTFYEPRETPPKLKENLYYLGLLYATISRETENERKKKDEK
jgi:hypothetical protein